MLKVISDFLGAILNVVSSIIFARIVLNKKIRVNKWASLTLILLISLCLHFFCYSNVTVWKSIIFFFLYAFLFKFFYSLDFVKTIMLNFFYFVIQIISEIIGINFLFLIISENELYNIIAGSFLGNIIVVLMLSLITLVFRSVILKFINIKYKYSLIFILLIATSCIVVVFYAGFQLGTNAIDKFLCVFCILVIFSALSYSFIQSYKNQQLVDEYDNLLSFIKKYEKEIDNQRIMRHETKNQLLTIKSKIIDKEKEDAILNYIDVIIKDGRKVNHSEYAKLQYLPSNGIKGLFYFKLSLAQDKGIDVDVNISKTIENSFLKELTSIEFNQIGKVLGVYLDNAIEASEKANKKMIGIEIFKDKDEIIFIISNTYNLNTRIFGRSSKGHGRGYGLLLVNSIISSNARLKTFTEITDDLYIKKLLIKK